LRAPGLNEILVKTLIAPIAIKEAWIIIGGTFPTFSTEKVVDKELRAAVIIIL
jgi:hypothetical protein